MRTDRYLCLVHGRTFDLRLVQQMTGIVLIKAQTLAKYSTVNAATDKASMSRNP